MRIAVVGSREYPRLDLVRRFVFRLPRETVVVSGGARGVDRTAENTARRAGLGRDIYLPDREKYGIPRCFFERNSQVVDACEKLVAFWDGVSNGTIDALRKAVDSGKSSVVVDPEGEEWDGKKVVAFLDAQRSQRGTV